MVIGKARANRRRGATAVETALVILPVLLLFFGIFQYGRFLMDYNALNNAAREGCRYALANNTNASLSTNVQTIVTNCMGGRSSNFTGFAVTVNGTHQGAATPVASLQPGDLITVQVGGTYQFLNLPLVSLPAMSMNSSVTMVCEGGT